MWPLSSAQKNTILICLMLANPLALSQLLLVSIPSLSLDCASKSVLSLRSPQMIVQWSFPLPTSIMPSISSPLKGQKMLSRSPNPSPASSINPSPSAPFIFTSTKLVWRLWSRPNALFSLPDFAKHVWTLPMLTKIEPWMTERGWYGLMRPRSNCLGSDGCKWVWKKPGEGLSDRLRMGTAKFGGGSIMIWGCMTWKGVGYATKIDGRMDSDLHLQILKDELQNCIMNLTGWDQAKNLAQGAPRITARCEHKSWIFGIPGFRTHPYLVSVYHLFTPWLLGYSRSEERR